MAELSRRNMLAGAAATSIVAAANPAEVVLASAAAATPMGLFLGLSSALTGISEDRLHPLKRLKRQRDPLNVKQAYFDRAAREPGFAGVLAKYEQLKAAGSITPDQIAQTILSDSNF